MADRRNFLSHIQQFWRYRASVSQVPIVTSNFARHVRDGEDARRRDNLRFRDPNTVEGYLKMGYSPVRAQIFTYLFFAIYLYLLEKVRLGKLRTGILWLIPLQIAWTNLHGGYLAGIGLLFIYTASAYITKASSRKILTAVLGLCLVSTLLNPYGLAYWVYTFEAVSMPRNEISEWWSIVKALQNGYGVIAIVWMLCSAVLVAIILLRQRKVTVYELGVLGITFALSVSSNRHIIFFLLASCALVPTFVQELVPQVPKLYKYKLPEIKYRSEMEIAMMFIFILSFSLFFTLSGSFRLNIPLCGGASDEQKLCYPTGAVEYIKQKRITGNILTLFEWGEYLIWETYPHCKIGLDGRYETVYPNWVCDKYFDFLNARPGWSEFLKQFPPDMILLPASRKVTSLIRKEGTWDIAMENSGSVLFIRKD